MYFGRQITEPFVLNLQQPLDTFSIEKYQPKHKLLWDRFIATSKNATFLFNRDFMEYHQDRFEDFSLLVFKDEKLMAVLPANRVGNELHSHQGLSYGGLVLPEDSTMNDVADVFENIVLYLKKSDIEALFLKMMPNIYPHLTSNELSYLLNKAGADLNRVDIEMAIDYSKPFVIHKTKEKHFKKASKYNFDIRESDDLSNFWDLVLQPKLESKYRSKPVHTLSEIQQLKDKFPNNIFQYDVYFEGEIVAGITLFETENLVKSQYGAANKIGENTRALEYLFLHLINKYKEKGKNYFSMGTVNGTDKFGFNKGLLKQKEELGCSVFLQEFYCLKLK